MAKKQVFHEVFVSPFEKDTESEALKVLKAIRDLHSEEYGWKEIDGFVERLPNGKYRAVREHAQYKWFLQEGVCVKACTLFVY